MIKIGQTYYDCISDFEYKRVSLATLKNMIKKGGPTTFYIVASKSKYYYENIRRGQNHANNLEDLEKAIDDFHFYNCNTIMGGSIHYYIKL